ncbi:lamin tail domain-containing protein [bacterium]|nr:lamin tail domain-containing protein [bacterium]
MQKWSGILLVVLFQFYAGPLRAQVVISEVMFNPEGSEHTDEFVEIVNLDSLRTVDLNGWGIGDNEDRDLIADAGYGLRLGPLQTGLVMDPDYSETAGTYEPIPDRALRLTISGSTFGSGGLSNSREETVRLIEPLGAIVDSIRYCIDIPAGHSWERIDLYGGSEQENWAQSRDARGTPGYSNSVSEDGNGCLQLNLQAAWSINEGERIDVRFELKTVNTGRHAMAEFPILFYDDSNRDSLTADDEMIGRLDIHELGPGDSLTVVLSWSTWEYGNHRFGLLPVITGDNQENSRVWWEEIVLPYPERALVINEIMADPMNGCPEWVELFNPNGFTVDLTGWTVSDSDTLKRVIVAQEPFPVFTDHYIVLCDADDAASVYAEGQVQVLGVAGFPGLNNSADGVCIADAAAHTVDRVDYHASWGGGNGVSLERIRWQNASQDSSNWHACTDLRGMTPGAINSISVMPASQSCLSVHPVPFSPDGDGREDVCLITVHLPVPCATITLSVFDVHGRLIRDLRNGVPSGNETVVIWDGLDCHGCLSRTGLYILYMEALVPEKNRVFHDKTVVVLARSR